MFSSIFYTAIADIKGSKEYPELNGNVYFNKVKDSVLLTAKIKGLPTSKDTCDGRFFGFLIHERNILHRKYY